MDMRIFFKNIETGREYDIVAIDKEAGTVTLKGELIEFTEPFPKDAGHPSLWFPAYKLVQEE
jgi:hypothetical protein